MKRELHFLHHGASVRVTITPQGEGWSVTVADRSYTVTAQAAERGRMALALGDERVLAHVARQGNRMQVHADGRVWELEQTTGTPRPRAAQGGTSGVLAAAMPGRVLDVLVQEGAPVHKGDTLVLLEAMKMELRIGAPADGIVLRVHVTPGQVVERAAALVELGPGDAP